MSGWLEISSSKSDLPMVSVIFHSSPIYTLSCFYNITVFLCFREEFFITFCDMEDDIYVVYGGVLDSAESMVLLKLSIAGSVGATTWFSGISYFPENCNCFWSYGATAVTPLRSANGNHIYSSVARTL